MGKASPSEWQVHRHGGGRKHGWRCAFRGNEKPARNQFNLWFYDIRQGGIRLVDHRGIIRSSVWLRHAPNAWCMPVPKDIGRKARLG